MFCAGTTGSQNLRHFLRQTHEKSKSALCCSSGCPNMRLPLQWDVKQYIIFEFTYVILIAVWQNSPLSTQHCQTNVVICKLWCFVWPPLGHMKWRFVSGVAAAPRVCLPLSLSVSSSARRQLVDHSGHRVGVYVCVRRVCACIVYVFVNVYLLCIYVWYVSGVYMCAVLCMCVRACVFLVSDDSLLCPFIIMFRCVNPVFWFSCTCSF